jgi:hypothetical protein
MVTICIVTCLQEAQQSAELARAEQAAADRAELQQLKVCTWTPKPHHLFGL